MRLRARRLCKFSLAESKPKKYSKNEKILLSRFAFWLHNKSMKNNNFFKFFSIVFASFCILGLAGCGKKVADGSDTHLAIEDGKPVVERYGQLQVLNGTLCNQAGKPVQLRGMSSHGLQWHGKYANQDVIGWLRDDWNCQLWRPAMYLTEGGYIGNKAIKVKVIDSIEACINLGMYVLVDWHVLGNGDPMVHKAQAIEFFTEIAQKYGSYPNIIYELCNEPNGDNVTWEGNIRPYAEDVIKAIRQYDKNNVIVVGTPHWSQYVDKVIANPLQDENVMYTVHFYAGSHGKKNMNIARKALKAGLPVFVTEWGCTKESGDGGVFEKETLAWIKFLEENNISWANWSVNNKGEDSGVLKYNADRNAKGHWAESDLSPAGIFVRKILRNETENK